MAKDTAAGTILFRSKMAPRIVEHTLYGMLPSPLLSWSHGATYCDVLTLAHPMQGVERHRVGRVVQVICI